MKVAILDDYQGVAQEFADWSKLNQSCDIKVFREPFDDEAHAIENLKNFEAFVIMRERTPITANLINSNHFSHFKIFQKFEFFSSYKITFGAKNSL